MWKMLQTDNPTDYVLATGTDMSVKDFVELSFRAADLDWQKFVKFDERYLRPTEVDSLVGDYSKAASDLDWQPSILPADLAKIMVKHDQSTISEYASDMPEGATWPQEI